MQPGRRDTVAHAINAFHAIQFMIELTRGKVFMYFGLGNCVRGSIFLAKSTLCISPHLCANDDGFARRGAVEGEGGAVVDVTRVGVGGIEEAARLDAAVHLALHLELSSI